MKKLLIKIRNKRFKEWMAMEDLYDSYIDRCEQNNVMPSEVKLDLIKKWCLEKYEKYVFWTSFVEER